MRPVKLVRITTIPLSMRLLLAGQPAYMRSKGMEVVLVSSEGQDWESIPDLESYPVYKINMSRRVDLKNDLRALWALIRLFRRLRPDIVHSHTPKAGLLAMLAAWITHVPVRLHTVAGLPLMERTGWSRRILSTAEKLTYRCASMVYPNSFRLSEYLEQGGFTLSSKLKVIAGGSSNGIDTEYFKPTGALREAGQGLRAKWGMGPQDLAFIYIGRIVSDKGVNELVQAFSKLGETNPFIRLILVGPFEDDHDPISPGTREIIDKHPRIHKSGFASDVRPYLAASDVLVFPSYREGFPNVPLQAGCFGLPCIVTDINGCNEIIDREVNGLIVIPKDILSLEQAMARLAADSALRARFGSVARERILQRYQQSLVWEALYQEYQRLLG